MNLRININSWRTGLWIGAVALLTQFESAVALPDIKVAVYDPLTKVITLEGSSFDPSSSELYVDGLAVPLQSVGATGATTDPTPLLDGTHEILLVDATGEDLHMLAIDASPGIPGPQGPPGVQGPAGPAGAVGFIFRGAWVATARYPVGDVVTYNGATYYCVASNAPNRPAPDVSPCWKLLAAKGAAGAVGPAGPAGPAGAKGTTGATGPAGAKGATGAAGPAGPQGPAGSNGKDGAVGPVGPKGDAGPQGLAGSNGKDGAPGVQGPAGLNGEAGPQGAAGPMGPAGQDGAVGPAGRDGKDGLPGTSIIGGGTGNANAKLDATKVNFVPLFDSNVDVAEANVLQVMPSSGTLSHFYVRLSANASNKDKGSYTFTVRKNGVDTGVTCVIGVGGKDPNGLTGMDLEHSVSFEEGDTISIGSSPKDNPTPVAMRWTARY